MQTHADVGERADLTGRADRQAFGDAVHDILRRRSLRTMFQPIVSLDQAAVRGFEALSRGPADHPFETAEQLLEAGRPCGNQPGGQCHACLAGAGACPAAHRGRFRPPFREPRRRQLPPRIDHPRLAVPPACWPLDRTVVELTAREPVADPAPLVEFREQARSVGVRIAFDDTGTGYAGLCVLEALRPDYIKAGPALTHECAADPAKRSMIASLNYVAGQLGGELIAAGVETMDELSAVRALGVDLVQGFLLGSPEETPAVARCGTAGSAVAMLQSPAGELRERSSQPDGHRATSMARVEGPGPPGDRVMLAGLMASGKTSVGMRLAGRLGWPYVDNDELLRTRTGCSLPEMAARGVDLLHEAEWDTFLATLAMPSPWVAGAASSIALHPDARSHVEETSVVVVWLRASARTLAARVRDTDSRPLLRPDPYAAFTHMIEQRGPAFLRLADLVVDVDGRDTDAVAALIIERAVDRWPAATIAMARVHEEGPPPAGGGGPARGGG